MTDAPRTPVRRVGIIGTGVIGSGWAARFLAHGLDVVASDPAAGAEQRLRDSVANAWPALTRVGLAPGADLGRLRFVGDVAACVRDADFVQESAPENDALNRRILADIDAAARPDAIIASSFSWLPPSSIQSGCRHPRPVVICHPFNSGYLLTLVELLGV